MVNSRMIVPIFLFFIVFGFLMIFVPAKVDKAEKTIYRSFRLISKQKAGQPLSPSKRNYYRVIGLLYLSIGIIVLANCRFQLEKTDFGEKISSRTRESQRTGDEASLHQTLNDIVQPLMEKHKHIGLAVAIIADEEKDISGFGRVNLDSDQPPTGETIFEIGSISKAFTGILLADMIDHKKLTLDTSVLSLLPSITINESSEKKGITLRHLVTHTSGLHRGPKSIFSLSSIWSSLIAGDSYQNYTEEMMLNAFSKKKLRNKPGKAFFYSNFGFGLLGLALSKKIGMDYHNMVRTIIAQPLGLKDTGVFLDEDQRSRLARGYRSYYHIRPFSFAQISDNWEFPNCTSGAGALRSTANDMMVFLSANMGRTKSRLTPSLVSSHKVLFRDDKTEIGMGWLHESLPESGEPIDWHNGQTGGYSSFMGFTENGRFGVVVLSNLAKKVDDIGFKILDSLVMAHRI